MNLPLPIMDVCRAVASAGGRAWIVGGVVRDGLMGVESKDHDIEVHGIEIRALRPVLEKLGKVNAIGKSFGVFKLNIGDLDCDVSIPRHDNQVGPGHKDVAIVGNPFMGIESAARRRDLTINAIAYDPLRDEFVDPFGGMRDIERARLVAVDPKTFTEDPLRVLRVVQFAARFGFSVQKDLADLCRKTSLFALPPERIWGEFEKLLLLAPIPSVGWALAGELGVLDKVLPDLAQLPSGPIEQALNRAADRRSGIEARGRKVALMMSALLHTAGVHQVEATLERLDLHRLYGYPVRKRVNEVNVRWSQLKVPVTDTVLRRLAEETEVLLVAETAYAATGENAALANLDRAFRLGIGSEPMPVLVKGRDLGQFGLAPGPEMGTILGQVREAQLDGEIDDRAGAILWLKDYLT
jgi:tRNA nucleotidyltransferase (CCA-adding enzyme)